jgi:hypothetical protein
VREFSDEIVGIEGKYLEEEVDIKIPGEIPQICGLG